MQKLSILTFHFPIF